jgi:hypothetical protein
MVFNIATYLAYGARPVWRNRRPLTESSLLGLIVDARVKSSGESGLGGCGMWVWIAGASVVFFVVPFLTFAWMTK